MKHFIHLWLARCKVPRLFPSVREATTRATEPCRGGLCLGPLPWVYSKRARIRKLGCRLLNCIGLYRPLGYEMLSHKSSPLSNILTHKVKLGILCINFKLTIPKSKSSIILRQSKHSSPLKKSGHTTFGEAGGWEVFKIALFLTLRVTRSVRRLLPTPPRERLRCRQGSHGGRQRADAGSPAGGLPPELDRPPQGGHRRRLALHRRRLRRPEGEGGGRQARRRGDAEECEEARGLPQGPPAHAEVQF